MLALATFAAMAQVVSTAHLLLVPHTVCSEHGEVIHGHGASETVASSGRTAFATQHGEPLSDGHSHCPVAALDRKQVAVVQTGTLLLPPPACTDVLQPVALELVLTNVGERLLLAPKTSPPTLHA
jgi:hypothetical protein